MLYLSRALNLSTVRRSRFAARRTVTALRKQVAKGTKCAFKF